MKDLKLLVKDLIAGGSLVEALQTIGENLKKDCEAYNSFILLGSQHIDIDRKIIAGTISSADELLIISQFRGRVIKFVDSLDESDLLLVSTEEIIEDVGDSDLPVGLLLAMGKMSPFIGSVKFSTWKETLGESKDLLLKANERKNDLATKAVAKLKAYKHSGSKDMRLLRRYIKNFSDAFVDLDVALVHMSRSIDTISVDHAALCMYNVQYAVAYHTVTAQDINEIIELSNGLQDNMKEICDQLQRKIDKEEEMYDILPVNRLGMDKSLKRSIQSKVQFIQSTQKWMTQMEHFNVGIKELLTNTVVNK